RQWQELFYKGNLVDADLAQAKCQPDFIKIADAYGIKGIRVEERTKLRAAIQEAMDHPGPVLMDVRVIIQENVWPMVPAGASLAETVEDPDLVAARAKKQGRPMAGD